MKALNRIVTALLAAAVFPVAYFTDLMTVYMHANIYDSNIVENLSIQRIISLFTGDGLFADMVGSGTEFPAALERYKANLVAIVVFFALALLVALATVIVAAVTNSQKTTAILGTVGLLCMIGMMIAFSGVSTAIKEGSLTLGGIAGMTLLNLVGKLVLVTLSTAPTVMLVLFLTIAIWNVAFIMINLGEEDTKKAKQKSKKKRAK